MEGGVYFGYSCANEERKKTNENASRNAEKKLPKIGETFRMNTMFATITHIRITNARNPKYLNIPIFLIKLSIYLMLNA